MANSEPVSMDKTKTGQALIFFNRVFPPNGEATAVLLHDLAKRLGAGVRVEVVCATRADDATIASARYTVRRLASPFQRVTGLTGRALEYAFFLMQSLWFVLTQAPRDAVLVFWSDPPFLDVLGGLLCRALGIRYVVVIQDWFLEGLAAEEWLNKDRFLFRGLRSLERRAYRHATPIVCISRDTSARLHELGLSNTIVIANWCAYPVAAERIIKPRTNTLASHSYPARCVLKYMGNLGFACDLEGFAEAIAEVDADRFLFIFQARGRRMPELRQLAARFDNVRIVDQVSPTELARSYRECDGQLILTPAKLHGIVYPSKLYTIAAAGMPVIASGPARSEIHEVIAEHNFGMSCASESPAALAALLTRFADLCRTDPESVAEMRQAARRFYEIQGNGARAASQYRLALTGNEPFELSVAG